RVSADLDVAQTMRSVAVLVGDRVRAPLDRREHEVLHIGDVREAVGDGVRLREVEADPARAAADLTRCRLAASLVAPGHDDVASLVRIGLRELAAETLRAADDDDCPC